MFTLFRTSLRELEPLPTTGKAITKLNKQRWHMAVAAIYCSRAFSSPTENTKISPITPPPNVIIDLPEKPQPYFPDIDSFMLVQIAKEKSLDNLKEHGGVKGIAAALKTNLEHGIEGEEGDLSNRRDAFGSNYKRPPTKGFFHFVWEALKSPTVLILMVCAALSLGFGIKEHGLKQGWYDGGSIFIAVFLVISVAAISNFRQNRQFPKPSKVSDNISVDVMRNGRRENISIFDIVVGDILFLKIGDQVPADGLFLDRHPLEVDESIMTGESKHVEVTAAHNPFLSSGTMVLDGFGRMLVTSVGPNTMWGQFMTAITDVSREYNGKKTKVDDGSVAFLVLVVLLIIYFTGNKEHNGKTKVDDVINFVIEIVAAAVTIVVVAIPEGLPLAVTLTLAYSTKRMMADQAMVRKLSACETMGSATSICTDKTGTLTMNQMKVTKFWLGHTSMDEKSAASMASDVLELFHQGVGLNTMGSVYKSDVSGSEFEFSGSPTEKAILSWAVLELNMDMEELKQNCTVLQVEAFNSTKKRSGISVVKNGETSTSVHWKGAAEMILAMCSHYYDFSGNVVEIDDAERNKFNSIIEGMAASSLRCIAFAHKRVQESGKMDENSLTLLGLVGLKDPCRPGVKIAVEDCQKAGVNIKMITGDNIFTAKAIATECGILRHNQDTNSGAVIEGEEFRNLTHEERMEKVENICVMARSSPLDKLLMVKCLREKGHVVAVTGDGTNDVPALKEADIGLSMGIQGTELAKESSDIVILDDNFASVAAVLRWGRCVYTNIQKFIQFQLTVNVAALVINFVAAVSAGEVPLTSVQLLWVNLIMGTLGASALATEKPSKELMEKPPVGRKSPLITNTMWRNLLAQALYQITILLILQFRGESIFKVSKAVNETLMFNTFVLCQVFNEFNARKIEKKNVFEGLHKNKLFMGIIGVTIVLQVVMVEFLKKFVDAERLNWGQWGVCVGFGAMSLPIGWIVKSIPVPERHFFSYLKYWWFFCKYRMNIRC